MVSEPPALPSGACDTKQYLNSQLFMGTVALVYSPLAPLVPVLAAVVFWISGVVYKYQLMFVFTTKVESGGVSFLGNRSCNVS